MKSRTVTICATAAQIITTEVRRGLSESHCPEYLVESVGCRLTAHVAIQVSNLKEGVSFDHIREIAHQAIEGYDIEALIKRLDVRSRPTPSPKPSYRNHAHGSSAGYRSKIIRGIVIA